MLPFRRVGFDFERVGAGGGLDVDSGEGVPRCRRGAAAKEEQFAAGEGSSDAGGRGGQLHREQERGAAGQAGRGGCDASDSGVIRTDLQVPGGGGRSGRCLVRTEGRCNNEEKTAGKPPASLGSARRVGRDGGLHTTSIGYAEEPRNCQPSPSPIDFRGNPLFSMGCEGGTGAKSLKTKNGHP